MFRIFENSTKTLWADGNTDVVLMNLEYFAFLFKF